MLLRKQVDEHPGPPPCRALQMFLRPQDFSRPAACQGPHPDSREWGTTRSLEMNNYLGKIFLCHSRVWFVLNVSRKKTEFEQVSQRRSGLSGHSRFQDQEWVCNRGWAIKASPLVYIPLQYLEKNLVKRKGPRRLHFLTFKVNIFQCAAGPFPSSTIYVKNLGVQN